MLHFLSASKSICWSQETFLLCLDKSHMQFCISVGFFLVWDFAHLFFDVMEITNPICGSLAVSVLLIIKE